MGPSGDDLSMGGNKDGGAHDLAVKKDMSGNGSGDMTGNSSGDMSGDNSGDMTVANTDDMSASMDMTMQQAPDMTSPFTTIFTIVLENTSYSQVVGNMQNAPYLNSLIAQGGLATMYSDSGFHPSLPNYLELSSGNHVYNGFGIFDFNPTDAYDLQGDKFPVDIDNIGNQMQQAGIAWRSYQESMPSPCALMPSGTYAPKHDGFLYYKNIQNGPNNLCATTNVNYENNFAGDLQGGTYRYMWITPNLNDDGHDTNLMTADTWCSQNVPAILNSATFKAGGILFVTWDEGNNNSDQVPMIIVSPRIVKAGYQSATKFNHASYVATVEDIFNLPRLADAQQAQNLMEFFQ